MSCNHYNFVARPEEVRNFVLTNRKCCNKLFNKEKLKWTPYFYAFYSIIASFFIYLFKQTTKVGWNLGLQKLTYNSNNNKYI